MGGNLKPRRLAVAAHGTASHAVLREACGALQITPYRVTSASPCAKSSNRFAILKSGKPFDSEYKAA